jgi:hypothetical protein
MLVPCSCDAHAQPCPCRAYNLKRFKRERAVLSGCSVGGSVALLAYPLVQALWGLQVGRLPLLACFAVCCKD